jgi:hypothetical protein
LVLPFGVALWCCPLLVLPSLMCKPPARWCASPPTSTRPRRRDPPFATCGRQRLLGQQSPRPPAAHLTAHHPPPFCRGTDPGEARCSLCYDRLSFPIVLICLLRQACYAPTPSEGNRSASHPKDRRATPPRYILADAPSVGLALTARSACTAGPRPQDPFPVAERAGRPSPSRPDPVWGERLRAGGRSRAARVYGMAGFWGDRTTTFPRYSADRRWRC